MKPGNLVELQSVGELCSEEEKGNRSNKNKFLQLQLIPCLPT